MVDPTLSPQGDESFDPFGDSGFDWQVAPGKAPAAPASWSLEDSASDHFPTRREIHGSGSAKRGRKPAKPAKQAKAAKPAKQRMSRAARPATKKSDRGRSSVRPYTEQFPTAQRIVVVRPAPKKRKRRRGAGLLSVLAVGGLFASVALPAYAFAPNKVGDADTTVNTDAALTGASISVADDALAADPIRTEFSATTAAALRRQTATAMMAANYAAYMQSGARELGDDYPWFSELSNSQGGGLSPLNYFYRECVDFVAWRLNRDAGSLSAPFLYTWKTLTPTGGNAYQWKYAWIHNGWATGTDPQVGAVAWFNYNHVAYVKSVNGDGTVTIEDYNQSGMHTYDQRVVPAASVSLYLYAPPR